MNILQIHNRYKTPGGEWTVLSQEYNLLNKNHTVDQLIIKNSDYLNSIWRRLSLIYKTHYNRSSRKLIAEKLAQYPYDIMHVHNFFPLLTPSIFEAAREAAIPSVLSLHNYRLIHPNGLMYHRGKIDQRSVKGSAYDCVWDGVYRDSKLQTAVAAHMIEYHRKAKTWHRFPTLFIALSEFSKNKFVEGGLPADRIMIKPNFLTDPLSEYDDLKIEKEKSDYFLFVGRVSNEKGIEDLINCWLEINSPTKLLIAGDGPIKSKLMNRSKALPSIEWLGQLSKKEVLKKLSKAKALIFPTKCFEGMPLILLEAMSMGCAVISSSIGNPKNMIDHGKNGLLYEPGDMSELIQSVRVIIENPEKASQLAENARERYLRMYTPEENYKSLMNIYSEAIKLEKERFTKSIIS